MKKEVLTYLGIFLIGMLTGSMFFPHPRYSFFQTVALDTWTGKAIFPHQETYAPPTGAIPVGR